MARGHDSETEPAPDQRSATRFTLMLRAGKLVSDSGQFLCILRDASATGIKARLFHELPAAARFELELGNGERHALEQVWQRDGHVGFRFADGEVDIQALMEEAAPFPKRTIRLRFDLPVLVTADCAARPATIIDLSQQGARIVADPGFALRQQLRIEAAGLPVRHGRVRWRRGNAHGVVFQEAFRLDELALLAARLQQAGEPAASAASAAARG